MLGKSDADEESTYLAIYVLYQENLITSDISEILCLLTPLQHNSDFDEIIG